MRQGGLIASNPARGARKFADAKRKTRLSLDQIRALGDAIRKGEAAGESATGLAAVRLILLTGFRRSEALGIRRDWILPAGGVEFPDTKSGPQTRPIGKAALRLLQSRFSDDDQPWAFPADRGEGHFVGLPKVLSRLCKKAKLTDITAHTLRHTFASVAGDLGYSELVIAGLLGHSSGTVTGGYVHLDRALVAAADVVANVIATALNGKQMTSIVRLQRSA